ncbi:MAG: hypothetical protein AB1627_12390 [Chloroflexota bacterium]
MRRLRSIGLALAVGLAVALVLLCARVIIDQAVVWNDGPPPGVSQGVFVTPRKGPLPLFDSMLRADPFTILDTGAAAFVASDPVKRDNQNWVRLQVPFGDEDGVFGWAGVGTDDDPSVATITLAACPPLPLSVGIIASLSPAERLLCFGDRQITIPIAMLIDQPGVVSSYTGDPDWLAEQSRLLMYGELGAAGESEAVAVHQSPEGRMPPLDSWITVTGHFGDNASSECRRNPRLPGFPHLAPGEAALWCRERFVVTDFDTVPAPRPSFEYERPDRGEPG